MHKPEQKLQLSHKTKSNKAIKCVSRNRSNPRLFCDYKSFIGKSKLHKKCLLLYQVINYIITEKHLRVLYLKQEEGGLKPFQNIRKFSEPFNCNIFFIFC